MMSAVVLALVAIALTVLFVSDVLTSTAFWQSPARNLTEGNNAR